MAVDPATLKVIASKVISIVSNEERRNNIILLVTILVSVIFFIIIIPVFLITSPQETIKLMLSNEEYNIVENLQNTYNFDFGMGNITIFSKLGFPLENADKVVITAEYGMYDPWNTGNSTMHTGNDLSGIHRDNVLAVENGVVTFAGIQGGYGNCIELKHIINGQEFYTFYAHLSAIGVIKGQEVKQGYIIGKEGGDPYIDQNAGNSTGHHLHFEIRTASGYGNSINPKEYIY